MRESVVDEAPAQPDGTVGAARSAVQAPRRVPRIEERGSIGTLLAAMRVHLPPVLSPAVAAREDALREREREVGAREASLGRREQKIALLEAELRSSAMALRDLEAEVRTRETRLVALRDYAILMQRTFRQATLKSPSVPESD